MPAIIEREAWLEMQDLLSRRRKNRMNYGAGRMLTGHLECAECGGSVASDSYSSTLAGGRQIRYAYYRCWRSRAAQATRAHTETCTMSQTWRCEALEGQVWDFLLEHLPDPVKLGAILGQDEKAIDHSSEKERLKDIIKRAGLAYTRGLLTELEADEEARGSRERLRELEALERSGPVRVDAVEAAQQLRTVLKGIVTLESKREFLKLFAVRVKVGVGGVEGVRVKV